MTSPSFERLLAKVGILVGHTPKSKTLDEVYLHPKATQMIEAFDKANQLVNDEVLITTKA